MARYIVPPVLEKEECLTEKANDRLQKEAFLNCPCVICTGLRHLLEIADRGEK